MPKIWDMVLNHKAFEFATSLNLNVGHCHMELHPKLKEVAHFDIS